MNNLPKKYDKEKLTKIEKDFLIEYTKTYNKSQSIKTIGLHKKNGKVLTDQQIIRRADKILSYPISKAFITNLQKQILDEQCFSLERSIKECYGNYEMLKERHAFHEMNISFNQFLMITGQLKNNSPVIQQQIVSASDKPVQIIYNIPDGKKE